MLEDLIKELDTKGILVMQILLGKRAMEVLELEESKSAMLTPKPKRTILHA